MPIELHTFLKEELQIQPDQLLELSVHLTKKKRLPVRSMMVSVVAEVKIMFEQILRTSTSDMAMLLRDPKANPVRRAEFTRVLVSEAFRSYSKEFRKIMQGNPRINTFANQIEVILEPFRAQIEAILSGKRTHASSADMDAEMERMLTKVYEEKELGSHFHDLLRRGKVRLVRMGGEHIKEHVAIAERLYTLFQHTPDSIADIALGQSPREQFFYPFSAPGGEKSNLTRGFTQSLDMAGQGTPEGRRFWAGLEGWMVVSEDDESDPHGLAIYGKSPLHPEKDPHFMEKKRQELAIGIAHGTRQYSNKKQRQDMEQHVLREPTIDLVLVIGKTPGAADMANDKTIEELQDVKPEEKAYTYTSGGADVILNGILMELEEGAGQNDACHAWLPRASFRAMNMHDENPEGPFNMFDVIGKHRKKYSLGIRPKRWNWFSSNYGRLLAKAARSHR